MNCQDLQKSLEGLLSAELASDEAAAVRDHLAHCRNCRGLLSVADRIEILPALDETVEPSSDIGTRFHARLLRHRSQSGISVLVRRWSRLHLAWAPKRLAAVALAATLIVGAVLVGRYLRTPQEPETAGLDLAVAENLPLLRDMDVISNLELLEDFEEIQAVIQDSPPGH